MDSVYIVIPAYNEAKRIGPVIESLLEKKYKNIIIVDDYSVDETEELLKKYPIIYTKHLINRGQGAALRTGTNIALENNAEIIVHFYADGQMSVDDIVSLIEPIRDQRVDVVLGSRFLSTSKVENIPLQRKALLKLAKIFNKLFLGVNYSDPQAGFRILSNQAAEKLNWENDRMAHCSEILRLIKKENLSYEEKPVNIVYTKETLEKGNNTMTAVKIVWDLFINKF